MSQRTHIDWLAVRTQAEVPAVHEVVRRVFGRLGECVKFAYRSRGWQGYATAADLLVADMHAGLIAYGGENQRGWVHLSISGKGCEWVSDWDTAQEELEVLPALDYRRVDIALDTVGQEVCHDALVDAYRAGMFTTAGRPPKCNRIESERPEDGRTVYIGARENDKFFRGYEKGKQLAAGTTTTHIGGVAIEDMYRLELELKAKSGALPGDLIDQRDQYFAGAYPYLQHVLRDVEPQIMVLDRRLAPMLDLERRLEAMRSMFGTTLFTALTVHQGDIGAVWERICGHRHNEDLLRSGVLLADLVGAVS